MTWKIETTKRTRTIVNCKCTMDRHSSDATSILLVDFSSCVRRCEIRASFAVNVQLLVSVNSSLSSRFNHVSNVSEGGAADASVIPTGFQCTPNQTHILCQCCVQPMPDRQDVPGVHQSCKSLPIRSIRE
jgi:hypothetical protein